MVGRLVSEQTNEIDSDSHSSPHPALLTLLMRDFFNGNKDIKIQACTPKCSHGGFLHTELPAVNVSLSSWITELVLLLWFEIKVETLSVCMFTLVCERCSYTHPYQL